METIPYVKDANSYVDFSKSDNMKSDIVDFT
jgi:hypothetical protein